MRSTILAALLVSLLGPGAIQASSGDTQDVRSRDWHGKFCTNCQPASDAPASRLSPDPRVATKLVAANTCADPGVGAWFAEEADHVTAFLNATAPQFK